MNISLIQIINLCFLDCVCEGFSTCFRIQLFCERFRPSTPVPTIERSIGASLYLDGVLATCLHIQTDTGTRIVHCEILAQYRVLFITRVNLSNEHFFYLIIFLSFLVILCSVVLLLVYLLVPYFPLALFL